MKFSLGDVVATPGVFEFFKEKKMDPNEEIAKILSRHSTGDWGDVEDADKDANDDALINEGRIMSGYKFGEDKVWIITEWNRSYTTVLLPGEY